VEIASQITVADLSFSFRDEMQNGALPVLDSITFTAQTEKLLVLVGPSGCGKTTMLNLVAGLLKPTSGHIDFPIILGGDPRRTAYVFQSPHLVPWLSVRQNALFGTTLNAALTDELEARCDERLAAYGLGGFENSLPHRLSGGMQQRVALLRALLSSAKVLLLDEPYANSDFVLRRELQLELSNGIARDKLLAILVTHDLTEAARMADEVVVLSKRPARVVDRFTIPIPRNARLRGETTAIRDMSEYLSRLERAVVTSNGETN
jgi:NitT/TauT family transport system ATP-binding protein